MQGFTEKFKLIYRPFLGTTIAFICGYTLINWFRIKTNSDFFNEELLDFWLPFILPWVFILVWLRKRIRLLDYRNDNSHFLVQFLVALSMTAPTLMAQHYLEAETGELTHLENIGDYAQKKPTKYYTLDSFYFDSRNAGRHVTTNTSGRYGQTLNLLVYKAVPVYESISDTNSYTTSIWMGKRYSTSTSSNYSDQKIDRIFNDFIFKTDSAFKTESLRDFTYLERLGNTEDRKQYVKAMRESNIIIPDEPVVLIPKTGDFSVRSGESLLWTFLSFLIGSGIFLIVLLFSKIDTKKINDFNAGVERADDTYDFLKSLAPNRKNYAVPMIGLLNILVFLSMVLSGLGVTSFHGDDLIKWGALYEPAVDEGQWWRLITYMFLHGGIMHIFGNLVGFYLAGFLLLTIIKQQQLLVIYFVSGIGAAFISLWWHSPAFSVGASGAIFGLYGLLLSLIIFKAIPGDISKGLLGLVVFYVGISLLIGLTGKIDNAAHIGGLVCGFVCGVIILKRVRRYFLFSINLSNIFIQVSPDYHQEKAIIPPLKSAQKTIARIQYELLIGNPYELTADDLIFSVHVNRKVLSEADIEKEREIFFSRKQTGLASSPLAKKFGWGVHFNEDGKVAIFPIESEQYKLLANDPNIKQTKAGNTKNMI